MPVVRQCVGTDRCGPWGPCVGSQEMGTAVGSHHPRLGCEQTHRRVWTGRGRWSDPATSPRVQTSLWEDSLPSQLPLFATCRRALGPSPSCHCRHVLCRAQGGRPRCGRSRVHVRGVHVRVPGDLA